jgi:carbamoyltransferase
MLLVADIKNEIKVKDNNPNTLFGIEKLNQKRSIIPAVTHVDYSARIQTVHKETNEKFYKLLQAFKKRTGCSVLINTSFNVRGEPIVCDPKDAIKCFLGTNLDILVMNNFIIYKTNQDSSLLLDYKNKYELD